MLPLSRRPAVPPSGSDLQWRLDGLVVEVDGVVDLETIDVFRSALWTCDADHTVFALDLTRIRHFVDLGARCLVDLGWLQRPHPIVIGSAAVRRVLIAAGIEQLLDLHGWDVSGLRPTAPRDSYATITRRFPRDV